MRITVVGGGIVGASAAFHLTRLGAEVCLVDSNASGRATLAGAGIVCPWLSESADPRYEAISFAGARYYPELVSMLAAVGETGIDYSLVGGRRIGRGARSCHATIGKISGPRNQGGRPDPLARSRQTTGALPVPGFFSCRRSSEWRRSGFRRELPNRPD